MAKREQKIGDEGQNEKALKEKKYVETPLMKQYYSIKAVHPDAILLFRVGDFYETFGEDAVRSSEILGITLTRRANGAASFVELAGFPHHSVDTYLPKLVRAGARVAICEQLEDPKTTKGLVKRGVVELITPGVVLDQSSLAAKENRYLAAVYFSQKSSGVAFLDISTGEFYCGEGSDVYIDRLISNFAPKEVLYQRGFEERFTQAFGHKLYTYKLDEWLFSADVNREKLMGQFGVKSLKGYGIEQMDAAISAAGAILAYLEFTEHKQIAHVNGISRIDEGDYVWIDRFTIRNLELFSSGDERRAGLAEAIDRTRTAMGGRMLRRWISMPRRDVERINARLDVVSALLLDRELTAQIEDLISLIGDMERIASRVAAERVTPRELVQLASSLKAMADLKNVLEGSSAAALRREGEKIDRIDDLRTRIAQTIYPDPQNNNILKGGIVADGVDSELDELRRIALRGKAILQEIVERESARTGIPSLKISFNNVFGYYIEVRNTHKDRVPEDWTRKQTLTSAERYITAELKEYEEKILGAEGRIVEIEAQIYARLLGFALEYLAPLRQDAALIARLDVLQSFARMACERRYTRPELNESTAINIREGRHPVIETLMPIGEKYIPNDVHLDEAEQQIIMVTGPNMSGKSALLRQTALIVLMAQIGSFVPAAAAQIGVVDKIFTRVGASDNISQGESTFMVEMLETASILNNISSRSLVILDEIGRGTSTYDGISIAWSIVEWLHNHPSARAKTMFATHYHELNEMEEICSRVKNFHVSVKEVGASIVFVRKLERGSTEHSFGIHVAKMAGMPQSVVERANEILLRLERAYRGEAMPSVGDMSIDALAQAKPMKRQDVSSKSTKGEKTASQSEPSMQLSMFQLDDPVLIEIRDQIKSVDVNNLTPIEALNILNQIKRISGL